MSQILRKSQHSGERDHGCMLDMLTYNAFSHAFMWNCCSFFIHSLHLYVLGHEHSSHEIYRVVITETSFDQITSL